MKGASIVCCGTKSPPLPFENLDLTGKVFVRCELYQSMKGANLTDAVFAKCTFRDVVTIDQLKQTWNYKNGRMDLIKLPPELQKYFDDEKAAAEKAKSVPATPNPATPNSGDTTVTTAEGVQPGSGTSAGATAELSAGSILDSTGSDK